MAYWRSIGNIYRNSCLVNWGPDSIDYYYVLELKLFHRIDLNCFATICMNRVNGTKSIAIVSITLIELKNWNL